MNMKLHIKRMNQDEARQISKWTYKEPYSIYSMDGSDDCIKELLGGHYFSVLDGGGNLSGYYCFGESAQVPAGNQFGVYDCKCATDIGLGMKPDLCGKGSGLEFFISGLDFARKELSAGKFRLTVASFNRRAIKVYEQAGFKKTNSFERLLDSGKTEFWIMTL